MRQRFVLDAGYVFDECGNGSVSGWKPKQDQTQAKTGHINDFFFNISSGLNGIRGNSISGQEK